MTATNHDDQRHNLVKFIQRCRQFDDFLKVGAYADSFSRFHCHGRHGIGPSKRWTVGTGRMVMRIKISHFDHKLDLNHVSYRKS